jgi:hypothetical protein
MGYPERIAHFWLFYGLFNFLPRFERIRFSNFLPHLERIENALSLSGFDRISG